MNEIIVLLLLLMYILSVLALIWYQFDSLSYNRNYTLKQAFKDSSWLIYLPIINTLAVIIGLVSFYYDKIFKK